MSKNRRRPERRAQRVKGSWYEPAWDPDYIHLEHTLRPERVRYVPEDWQQAWGATTAKVCQTIHRRRAWRMYPYDEQARDDLLSWLYVRAQEFANKYVPKREPDAEEHWGSALASVLITQSRWHWADYRGKTTFVDAEGERHTAAMDSIDRLLERATAHQTIHATSRRINEGGMWVGKPVAPERYVLLVEAAERQLDWLAGRRDEGMPISHTPAEAKDRSLCTEYGCQRPARTRHLCAMHYNRAWVQWGSSREGMPRPQDVRQATTCTAPGCDVDPHRNGLCLTHWQADGERCTVTDCDERAYSLGMCRIHYRRHARTGSTDAPTVTTTCTIDGCDRPHSAKGMCLMHYKRARKASAA